MAERELLSAVVAADRQTLAGRNHEDRPVAAGKLAEVCGDYGAQENDAQRDEIYLMTDSLVVRSMV